MRSGSPGSGRAPILGHPWWEARRLRYNGALVLAGFLAEALFIAATVVFADRIAADELEVTAFTIAIQGVGYGCAMLLANLCYFLGPLGERFIEAAHRSEYRTRAYTAGLALSIALPMLWPLSVWFILLQRTRP